MDNDYELKPRTINLITTNVEDTFRFKHSLCLIEGLNNPPAGIEIVSQCVTRPRFIVARNLKETTVNLKKGTQIGVIYAIPESKRGVACLNTMYPGEKTYPDPDVFKDQIRSPYYNLLREYGDVVAHEGYDLGQTHIVKHKIPLLEDAPIKQILSLCGQNERGIRSTNRGYETHRSNSPKH